MKHVRENGLVTIVPHRQAEERWREDVLKFANMTLLPTVDSVSQLKASSEPHFDAFR
jgi:hypothetical protein